ncbi:ABC transporter ATP-binding protein [Sinosporangium siamense]|uniref:Multidrug ABC transporter ATP-binding protein n=1 Tax=Sinosporangium siamense TaxID=1367973 RepID=A0A919RK03_9ACTN|nr:ABC transporter ATP-binding protein [Sinosporangium siamense]GII95260.1 multidrug ABC transporter ATP-binding protein [Sinosporangium siamense]
MTTLPVAGAREVRAHARRLTLRHPRELAVAVALHLAASAVALAGPRLLGDLVDEAGRGIDRVDRITLVIVALVVTQAILVRSAMYASAKLGEKVLAELREEFVDTVVSLPLAVVERAGTGDLVTRTTRDVDVLSRSVRMAVPDTLTAAMTILLTMGALVLVGPLMVLPCLVAVPVLWAATRWYLARARDGYLRQSAAYADLTDGLAETVDGARTVEALELAGRRFDRVNRDIARSYATERYTLHLRTVYLPICDTAYVLPVVTTLIFGGLLYIDGRVSLAAVTAATLYVQQLLDPVDRLLYWMDDLQIGGASLARILGVGRKAAGTGTGGAPQPACTGGEAQDIAVKSVSYSYREGHDVLHKVDLDIRRGERLAVVGPSGAGKSTLGRLIAGIHEPREGVVTLGGTPLTEVPLGALRREIALVTQDQHVFQGTLRDNLTMADPHAGDAELEAALRAVDAWEWAGELGLDTEVGPGRAELSPSQSQQLALARLILVDPHTLVLDEATSQMSPVAARRLERSLAAVMEGRTVIAIAHRLHTAHDADRVVVMAGGRVGEVGTHDELVARGGIYAGLWNSWHGGQDAD